MLRRASAHPRRTATAAAQMAAAQTERTLLLRYLLSRPGVLAEGMELPGDVDALDGARLVERLEQIDQLGPLQLEDLEWMRVGADDLGRMAGVDRTCEWGAVRSVLEATSLRKETGVQSVAAAVEARELPGHELDLVAYETAVLHGMSVGAPSHLYGSTQPTAQSGYSMLQSLRCAAGISRREASHIEALIRSAKELEREFDQDDVPDGGSLEYRLFLCRPELVSAALAAHKRGGMAPDEVLAWISRQLALVGIGKLCI